LTEVHGWSSESAESVVDSFLEAYRSGVDRVNNKALNDPTNPKNWDSPAGLIESSERSERSSVFGGGAGG